MKIPQLPKEARAEMPGATENAGNYKGTFLWWVVIALSSVVTVESGYIVKLWGGNQQEIRQARADCAAEQRAIYEPQISGLREALHSKTQEFNELKYILIPQLNQLKPVVEETKKKVEEISDEK